MPELFKNQSNIAVRNAQLNLMGRTHYVDPDTLKYHHSRVLSSHVIDSGLLFAIVTSDSKDWENKTRGFRYVVFDVFGNVLARPGLEGMFSTRNAATKAMWAAVNAMNCGTITVDAIAVARKRFNDEMEDLQKRVVEIKLAAMQQAPA